MLIKRISTLSGGSYRLIMLCVIFLTILTTLLPMNVLASSRLQIVADEFVKDITSGWKSFEICEYYSPGENRDLFFARALNLKPATAGKVIEAKELVIRESSGDRGVHLGIVELEFSTIELAERVHSLPEDAKQQFFSGTKVLTRYVSLRKDQRILLVYSETHMDIKVNGFFEQVGNIGKRLWIDR